MKSFRHILKVFASTDVSTTNFLLWYLACCTVLGVMKMQLKSNGNSWTVTKKALVQQRWSSSLYNGRLPWKPSTAGCASALYPASNSHVHKCTLTKYSHTRPCAPPWPPGQNARLPSNNYSWAKPSAPQRTATLPAEGQGQRKGGGGGEGKKRGM